MLETLKNLYVGNIVPSEKINTRGPKFKEATQEMYDVRENLSATLSKDQLILLDTYDDICCKLSSITEEEAFLNGFSLAIKLMTEALSKDI